MNVSAIRVAAMTVGASKPVAAAHHLSGLQREVLSLYRSCLRQAAKKPADSKESFKQYARMEFRKHAGEVSKKDFSTVEHLLRRGRRQLDMLSDNSIRRLNIS